MTDVLIHGDIGFEVRSADIIQQLAGVDGDVVVRVNSGGGDVYEGLAIMNAMRAHPGEVLVIVEGLAASAASFIAVGGGTRVVCRPHAELMIHEAWAMADGNAADMTKAAGDLDRVSANLASIYADRAGGGPDVWRQRMQEETWFSAEEALAAGLVDAVEDARTPVKPAALGRSRVMARFRFNGRREAPAPDINAPAGQKEEQNMTLLNELAQTLGKSEDQVLAALGRLMNEEVTVTSTVEVEYPEGTTVVPTGKATIEPVGEVPEGLVFAVGEVPEGWSAEVDESTGVLTVTAPAEAEPDAEVTIPVTVSGDGEPVDLVVGVAAKAAAEEDEPTEAAPEAPAPEPETVTLDRDTYAYLVAAAKHGADAKAKADADARAKQVDAWIREGRINAAHRAKVVAVMERDETAARELYGSIPKNTIPVKEIGHGLAEEEELDGVPSAASLRALSASRKSGK